MFRHKKCHRKELPEDDTKCVETCRSSLFVISTIIVKDIYVRSLVEFKIIKRCTVPLLRLLKWNIVCTYGILTF
jgi:hypothetical protein